MCVRGFRSSGTVGILVKIVDRPGTDGDTHLIQKMVFNPKTYSRILFLKEKIWVFGMGVLWLPVVTKTV